MKVIALQKVTETRLIDKYRKELQYLIIDYYKECHEHDYKGSSDKALAVVDYWEHNYFLYLVLDDAGVAIGFLVMSFNDQLAMTKPYLVVDYMYVLPKFRGTRATQWLFLTVGKVANELGMDVLGTTLAGSSNNHNSEMMNCDTIATVRMMKRDSFNEIYKKYSKRLHVKITGE